MQPTTDITPAGGRSRPAGRSLAAGGLASLAAGGLAAGGVLLLLKLLVIVAADGRTTDTGAAAAFLLLGVGSLLVGTAAAGAALTRGRRGWIRALAAAAGVGAFFAGFAVADALAKAAYGEGEGYWRDELAILVTAVLAIAGGAAVWSAGRRRLRAGAPRSAA